MSPARVSLDPSQRSADSIELTEGLKNLVIGQDEACEKLARRIVFYRSGIRPKQKLSLPSSFMGPSSIGKTRSLPPAG